MKAFEFKNVSFIRDGKKLLNNINWKVENKQNWAIIGLNGAGKTLLLQLICGYLWPSSGCLEVLNQTFGQTSIPDLQRRIGWVSTALQYQIKNGETAEKIVLSGKFASIGIYEYYSDKDLNQAKEILKKAGGSSLVGKKYQVLSQGERQLVLISRALMARPELLILDEPCNGLDLFAREKLLKQIQAIAEEPNSPTLLYVSHHTEEILPCFEHLMLLKDGTIFAQGMQQELFTEAKLSEFYSDSIEIIPLKDTRFAVYPR
ncbi:ABC transporter ATP-binding protein [Enterococcus rivorum]|uniref:Molybdenum ABC transporter ATP-binding protein n=1 Tax=Enterococcus rivorum TaxID=762845 RepID=A0A1E5KZJ3_9ENTE|nr:ABC transporter ATP-binding protein [Enterococcus rivorum]MBP2099338.1 iron complex transport system ATP-binding protein [Enterococcus rivorum]OEH83281.1 molybdenum ABC transporter ATP-binding protein [Enterococcus rivorum]